MLDVAIYHHSIGWTFNRYNRGTLHNVNTVTDSNGNISEIHADFLAGNVMNGLLGANSVGDHINSVTLHFTPDGINCIRFADNKSRCGLVSKLVQSNYLEGAYVK